MRKIIPIMILALVTLLVGVLSAEAAAMDITVNLTLPVNDTVATDSSTRTYTFNVSGNSTIYDCDLNVSTTLNGVYTIIKSVTEIVNNSASTITETLPRANGAVYWLMDCIGNNGDRGGSRIFNYSLNVVAPTVSLIYPANESTHSDTSLRIYGFNVSGGKESYTCEVNTTKIFEDSYTSIKTILEVPNGTVWVNTTGIMSENAGWDWRVWCYNALNEDADMGVSTRFNYSLEVQEPLVILNAPTNRSFLNQTSVDFNWTVTGAGGSFDCELINDEDGTLTSVGTFTSISNGSSKTTTRPITNNDRLIQWSVNCTDTINTVLSNQSQNFSFTIDITDPVVTIGSLVPGAGAWLTSNASLATQIYWTIVDTNADTCQLISTLNSTTNATSGYGIIHTQTGLSNNSVVNDTLIFNATFGDDGTGLYIWNYMCNDTAGHKTRLAANRSFYIDTVNPTAFNMGDLFTTPGYHNISNGSTTTELTPEINWTATTDLNFSRYEINFYTTPAKTTVGVQKNVTTIGTTKTNMTPLTVNTEYYLQIETYDLAGNSISATVKDIYYNTTDLCRTLDVGWNICGNLGESLSLSSFLNDTGATSTAYFNTTNQFVTYVDGGNNGAVQVPLGSPVFMFFGAAATWETSVHDTDFITRGGNVGDLTTLRNQSNTDWNIVVIPQRNMSMTIAQFEYDLNTNNSAIERFFLNVTAFSKFNNTAPNGSKYTPYVANISFNNDTRVEFGDTIWIHINDEIKNLDTVIINWSNIRW